MANTKMLVIKELLLDTDHVLSTICLKACDCRTNEVFWHVAFFIFQCPIAFCLEIHYTSIKNMSLIKKKKKAKNARFHFNLICHFFTFLILQPKIFAWG